MLAVCVYNISYPVLAYSSCCTVILLSPVLAYSSVHCHSFESCVYISSSAAFCIAILLLIPSAISQRMQSSCVFSRNHILLDDVTSVTHRQTDRTNAKVLMICVCMYVIFSTLQQVVFFFFG